MAKLWITRPLNNSESTANSLQELGHEPLCEALLTYQTLMSRAVLFGANDVLAFTSAFAVEAFCAGYKRQDLTAYCVGDSTADTAKKHGFTQVFSADGDVTALQDMLKEKVQPQQKIWHFSAKDTAGDLQSAMESAGFTIEKKPLYATEVVNSLSDEVRTCDGVLLYSPKTAKVFCQLQESQNVPVENMTAFCLSANVKAEIEHLNWRAIIVADSPKEADLLQAIQLAKI